MATSHVIPPEFLPRENPKNIDENTDNETCIGSLFADDKDQDEQDDHPERLIQVVTVGHDQTYTLSLPPDVGTLFAHCVWSGSLYLSDFLARCAKDFLLHQKTVELGAGTGLPSLVALAHGSDLSILTDYPDELVLQSLRETVGLNWDAICDRRTPYFPRPPPVAVVGHDWGTSVDPVVREAMRLSHGVDKSNFDLAILSECLWMHRSHAALARSVDQLVHPKHGRVVLTYAHHVPGYEEEDDAFFELCSTHHRLVTVHQEFRLCPYMWDDTKTITVYLRVLARPSGAQVVSGRWHFME
jgi:nicotinamide N-methyltransferase